MRSILFLYFLLSFFPTFCQQEIVVNNILNIRFSGSFKFDTIVEDFPAIYIYLEQDSAIIDYVLCDSLNYKIQAEVNPRKPFKLGFTGPFYLTQEYHFDISKSVENSRIEEIYSPINDFDITLIFFLNESDSVVKFVREKFQIEQSRLSRDVFYSFKEQEHLNLFLNGIKENNVKRYYEDGQLSANLLLNLSKLHGRCIWYYPNGCEKMIGEFNNGMLHGEQLSFWENGFVKEIATYSRDGTDNNSLKYTPSGSFIKKF